MPTPSLLIVPARFKTGRLYSQIPTNTDNRGDFTVTRNTAARRFNSAGLIESVASGIPRLDYYTSGGVTGCPALLVEPAATNLCLQSTDTTTSWALGANLTSGAIDVIGVSGINLTVAVSGSSIGDTPGANRMATINATLTSGSTYTISFLMKKTGAHTIGGFFANTSGATSTAFGSGFDVSGSFSSGSLIATSPITNRIRRVERFGSDVFRCSETFTMTATNVLTVLRLGPTVSVTSLTNSAVGTELGFAAPQIELGSVPTSFIPTTAGTGSRGGDLVSVTGAVSGSIGQTAGTFYLDLTYSLRLTSTATRWIQIFGSSNNIGLAVASTNIVRSIVNGQSDNLSTPSTANGVKIAWGYDGSGVVCFVNGTQYTLTNGGAQIITQLNQISLDLSTTNAIGNCRLRAMALYTTRLTNDELQSLTTL
jgi:hypothetical protein